ncbi:glycosyltransferase [Paraburkholderia nemoris]|uniref:glycosyltransferase n=1 Tax=Paraburkholderia nemoris TaxID=2793076 RepID=UPI0038B92698
MKRDDIILFSTADWDNPFWTNKQHVAVELARRGHRVLYVESIGLRQPSVTGADISRLARRLIKGLSGARKVRNGLWVWSPLVIPFQRYSIIRKINRFLLNAGLAACLVFLRFERSIAWTYNPLTTRFFNISNFKKVIYHCVDEIKAQPGIPADIVDVAEKELTKSCNICFVTSEHLLKTRKEWKAETYYFPNVADYTHFSKALGNRLTIPKDLQDVPSPRIGFVGAISRYKIDFELIESMAISHPEWSIVLIGKVGEGDPDTEVSAIEKLPNVYLMGPRPYEVLPAYLKGLDVALLPNKINAYTQAMFPMKFFEYIAAGKPVVATNLNALSAFSEACSLAEDHDSFIRRVEEALSDPIEKVEKRLELARNHTYEQRTARMMDLVNALGALQ